MPCKHVWVIPEYNFKPKQTGNCQKCGAKKVFRNHIAAPGRF